jgi:hypothetical protein
MPLSPVRPGPISNRSDKPSSLPSMRLRVRGDDQPLPEAVRPAPAPRPRSACAAERTVAPPRPRRRAERRVRRSDGAACPLSVHCLQSHRDGRVLAIAMPIGTSAGPAAGSPFALMSYGVAAGVLQHLQPVDAGRSPETLRNHTLRTGEQLGTAASGQPTTAAAAAITVSVGSTFIRSREEGERHLEVCVGNVGTASVGRTVTTGHPKPVAHYRRLRRAPGPARPLGAAGMPR